MKAKSKPRKDNNSNHNFYREIISSLSDNIQENNRLFESKFTYLCAGSFLFSISIVSNTVDIHNVGYSWLIFMGWAFLLVALLLNLFSCFYCMHSANKTVNEIKNCMGNRDCYDRCILPRKNKRIKLSNNLNKGCAVLFTLGCLALYVYLFINLH